MLRTSLLAVLLAMLLAAPAGAAEPWGTARTIEAGGLFGVPAADIDERGFIVAAWTDRRGDRITLRGARRTPRRGFRRAFALRSGEHTPSDTAVRFDGRRTALIGYRRWYRGSHRIELRAVRPSGRRTTPQLVLGGGASALFPSFADPAFDRPVFAWTRTRPPGQLRFARLNAEGRVVRVVTWDFAGEVNRWSVAAEPDGRVIVAFVRDGDVHIGRGTPDGNAIVAERVSDPTATAREPALAVAADGSAAVAWTEDGPGTSERVMAAVRRAGTAGFGQPQLLAGGPPAHAPRAVATAHDALVVTWIAPERQPPSQRGPLLMARLGDGTPFVQPVSRRDHSVEQYDVDPDGRGGVTLAWTADAPDEPGGPLYAVAVTPRGTVGKVQRLTPSGERTSSFSLAAGARGDAFALWVTRGGNSLRAARRPG